MGLQMYSLLLLYYLISSLVCDAFAEASEGISDVYCERILRAQTQGTRRDGHHEFRLRMEGDPETYEPGSTYRVVLMATSPAYFRGFTLIALKEGREGTVEDDYAGQFQIIDEGETQFMTDCPPAVTESTPRRRTRIQVFWTAPAVGAGCVTLKASIFQKKIIYFQDEGSLTIPLCEKEHAFGEATETPEMDCCACGTAKYRLTFHGNWSEKVHPKDYPRRANHWSALIGASHSKSYMLWEYGGFATEGVRQVAEFGSPIRMEEEIRQKLAISRTIPHRSMVLFKGNEVMTVIKTKAQWPAWQPLNLRAAPSAEFFVDQARHLMSFLTMLGPSPDWNVGLSGEDLCTKECGWIQKLVADLIPWDAGTDSGVTYESPNKPTIPQDKIRPLTSLDHPQSPFYDPEGGAIIPLARITVERIARTGQQCNVIPDTLDDIMTDIGHEEKKEDNIPETCIYSEWSPWSACSSATCEKGRQMRQRMLKAQLDPTVPCPHTQDFQPCMTPGCTVEETFTCMMSEWISWSPCSVSCGMGMRSRERYIKQFPEDSSLCQHQIEETEKCVVNDECSPSGCVMTEWLEWEPCSTTCGLGTRRRERMIKMPSRDGSICNAEMAEVEKCMMPKCHTIPCMLSPWSAWSECSVTCGLGIRTRQRMLNSDSVECPEELEQSEKCMLPECPIDCMVSDWSDWYECNKSCGKGHTIRTRMVKLEPQFGGSTCPETIQRKKCKIRKCQTKTKAETREVGGKRRRHGKAGSDAVVGDQQGCRMQSWTSWTYCSKSCGGGIQERFMYLKKRVKGSLENNCKDRKEIRACHVHPC
ncbi:spondin-1-like isoform X3 [Takifugu flavidus]|uniref:spondin-1-like isoform X3 n=1 Tax=Takifugu flavidus TaxID=433684 RepID=UPI00254466DB|nr:spondin-1-like isoform X3 [Takifugu flavidus]